MIRSRLPVVFLVLANLLPLAGVIWFGWSVFLVMLLFWLENIIVGLLNIPRIVFAMGDEEQTRELGRRVFTAIFFTIHYGLFTLVHGMFVFSLFADNEHEDMTASLVLQIIDTEQLYWAIAGLFLSHLVSLVMNYFIAGEYRSAKVKQMMKHPYDRIVVLHVGLLLGGILIEELALPLAGLLVLLVLKIIFDVRVHLKAHKLLANDTILSD